MISPTLCARVEEQPHDAAGWINRSEISSLEVVAKRTGAGKVFADRLSAMSDGDDVIYLMGIRRVVLMNQAVFTTLVGSLYHKPAQLVGKIDASQGGCGKALLRLLIDDATGAGFEQNHDVPEVQVFFQLRFLFRRQTCFAVFVEEFFQPFLGRC